MSHVGRRVGALAAWALAVAASVSPAAQWDVTSGDYHTHLIGVESGFELHLHDRQSHQSVDTSKGRVVATLLVGKRTETIPLVIKQKGILAATHPLKGEWTLLVRLDVPGRKSAQVRYSSKMKQSGASDHHDDRNQKK